MKGVSKTEAMIIQDIYGGDIQQKGKILQQTSKRKQTKQNNRHWTRYEIHRLIFININN